jgi:hypothetical protein
LTAVFPFTISDYDEGEDVMCDIHFCVLSYPLLEFLLPGVMINNGLTFALTSKLPVFFVEASYILLANQGRSGFNANT